MKHGPVEYRDVIVFTREHTALLNDHEIVYCRWNERERANILVVENENR